MLFHDFCFSSENGAIIEKTKQKGEGLREKETEEWIIFAIYILYF